MVTWRPGGEASGTLDETSALCVSTLVNVTEKF